MFGFGTTELIIIGIIIFLLFGAKRLPEIGRGLGSAIREFKKAKREIASPSEDKSNPQKEIDKGDSQ